MTEREIIEALKAAFAAIVRGDTNAYLALLARTEAAARRSPGLLGEWLLVSALSHRREPSEGLPLYRRAAGLIKGRSRVLPEQCEMFLDSYSPLAIMSPRAGEMQNKIAVVDEAAALFHSLTGGAQGIPALYRAQIAYYQGDLTRAKALADEARSEAEAGRQQITALCAAHYQAEIGKHTQDSAAWTQAREAIRDWGGGESAVSRACREHAQAIDMLLDLSIGVLTNIPDWLRAGNLGAYPTPYGYQMKQGAMSHGVLPSLMIAYLEYCLYTERPEQALICADTLQAQFRQYDVTDGAYLDFWRAGAYQLLGENALSLRSIESAVRQLVPDGLWLIAAEFLPVHGEAIMESLKDCGADATDSVLSLGRVFWDKLRALRGQGTTRAVLTKREREVAGMAARGMRNARIAEALGIGEGTVKYHLFNCYAKLEIDKRGELSKALGETEETLATWAAAGRPPRE